MRQGNYIFNLPALLKIFGTSGTYGTLGTCETSGTSSRRLNCSNCPIRQVKEIVLQNCQRGMELRELFRRFYNKIANYFGRFIIKLPTFSAILNDFLEKGIIICCTYRVGVFMRAGHVLGKKARHFKGHFTQVLFFAWAASMWEIHFDSTGAAGCVYN